MRYVVDTLTAEGNDGLQALREKGAITIQMLEVNAQPDKSAKKDFRAMMERLSGVISREEGDAIIAKVRYERDHDWQ